MRILIAEDEPKIGESLKTRLEMEGYIPEIARDGERAWFLGSTESYSAAILDLGLPKLDGLSVLRRWREEGIEMPVLILSALGAWPERVSGIDAGADDYLVKPFQMEELLARLRALVRRANGRGQTQIKFGKVVIDLRQKLVSEDDLPIALSPLEFKLLQYLAHNPGRAFSREELATNIYDADQEPGSNAIEVLVGRLRKKFSSSIIETRRGYGYCLNTDLQ